MVLDSRERAPLQLPDTEDEISHATALSNVTNGPLITHPTEVADG
jgi:hypothetical protein